MDEDDGALSARIARTAGAVLLALRAGGLFQGRALGDAGDGVANGLILRALRAARPEDAVLSEESADDLSRLQAHRVWIVDPLDGTREYAEGRPDWAVHVALVVDGRPVAGAVALPDAGLVRATCDTIGLPSERAGSPRMVVSRSRPPPEAARVAERLGAEIIPMGSAGAKAMSIVQGEAEIYLHSGGQHEWDSCAPAAVAASAGLHVSRLDGSALVYNRRETYLPDLLICRPEWAERVLGLLAEA